MGQIVMSLNSTPQYVKDNLTNTTLPTLIVEREKRYKDYPQIGFGDEGSVHKYSDQIAFKVFDFISNKEKLPKKFEKIELLGHLYDVAACFPQGLVGYEDCKKEGYFYEYVHPNTELKDFYRLQFLKDMKKKLQFIIQADEAIKRFHQMGIIIGDIKGDNIMVDVNGNIKFVDTDNWMYGDYGFDTNPGRTEWLSRIYNRDFSLLDNDKFVYAMLALQSFIQGTVISMANNDRYFEMMIRYLNIPNDIKEGLRVIFSDAINKPYISDIFKNINLDEELISSENACRLNRFL